MACVRKRSLSAAGWDVQCPAATDRRPRLSLVRELASDY